MKLILVEGTNEDKITQAVNGILNAIDNCTNCSTFINLVHGILPLKGKDHKLILDTQATYYRKTLTETITWAEEDEYDVEVHNTSFLNTALYDIYHMGMDKRPVLEFITNFKNIILSKFNPNDVYIIRIEDLENDNEPEDKVLQELIELTPFKHLNINNHFELMNAVTEILK